MENDSVISAEIIYEGNKYIHEEVHRKILAEKRPEALNWCNMMVGSIGNISLWSCGEYRYWRL